MSHENIPYKIDPYRFAAQGIHLHGSLPVNKMNRLCSSLSKKEGEVEVDIQFGTDEQGTRFMRGQFSATVVLQCQRCLNDFSFNINGSFLSGFVRTEEEAKELSKTYDPIITDELIIAHTIEDELILSLPLVPKHLPDECNIKMPIEFDSVETAIPEKENPFKVIELLRKRNPNKV